VYKRQVVSFIMLGFLGFCIYLGVKK